MTIQEIEQKIGGSYNKAANKSNIIKMWELIGDNYRRIEMNNTHRIVISDELYNKIRREISYSVVKLVIRDSEGRQIFISTEDTMQRLASLAKKSAEPKPKQKPKEKAPYGIYCIQYRGEVVYIGMTLTSFEQRWKEHLQLFKNPKHSDMILYHSGLNPDELEFRPMVDLTKEKANKELTKRDIKVMEMGLIACFKPRFNVSGVKIPYRFDRALKGLFFFFIKNTSPLYYTIFFI